MEISNNQNNGWSQANGLTKTLHDRFKVSSDDLSHFASYDTNKQI